MSDSLTISIEGYEAAFLADALRPLHNMYVKITVDSGDEYDVEILDAFDLLGLWVVQAIALTPNGREGDVFYIDVETIQKVVV